MPRRAVYLHGFASSPASRKALFFQERFAAQGVILEIPDLAENDFEHLTVTRQLQVVEALLSGDTALLLGSSLGGYLAALHAERHPGQVDRLILLAPGFTFPRRWPESLGPGVMDEWRRTGRRSVFHYGDGRERPLHYGLIEDAQAYPDYPRVAQPTLLFHGTRDTIVPPEVSVEFARQNPHADLRLLESGHELTDVLDEMWEAVRQWA